MAVDWGAAFKGISALSAVGAFALKVAGKQKARLGPVLYNAGSSEIPNWKLDIANRGPAPATRVIVDLNGYTLRMSGRTKNDDTTIPQLNDEQTFTYSVWGYQVKYVSTVRISWCDRRRGRHRKEFIVSPQV